MENVAETRSLLHGNPAATDGFRKRVQLDFSREAYQRIQELKRLTAAGTLTKVIRQALLFFDWYTTYRSQGYTMQMKGPKGEVIDVPDLQRTFT